MGIHQKVSTQSLNVCFLFFFLSYQHTTEEMECFLAVVKAREAISHLYILERHLQVWKAIQNVPISGMLRTVCLLWCHL